MFYRGNTDGVWSAALRQNTGEFDEKSLVESFAVSITATAGLISAGQPENAREVLNTILPLAKEMLLSQHPRTIYFLNELSMDTSQTAIGDLRTAVKLYLSSLAHMTLGAEHPVIVLLKTPLTTDQRVRLRMEAQRIAHEKNVKAFGAYSWQTMVHLLFWGRLTAHAGHFENSLRMFEMLTETWDRVYGTNSAVAITGLVELARVMIAKGDARVKVECLVGDAIRRNNLLGNDQDHEPRYTDAAEACLRGRGLLFSRIAALRVLGRVHVKRQTFGAAFHSFEQAMAMAEARLNQESSVLQLCKADLEAAANRL